MNDLKKKILAVDDEATMLEGLRYILELDGYEVLTAESGLEAFDLLTAHEIVAVISDQNMPGIKGEEVLRKAFEIRPNAGENYAHRRERYQRRCPVHQ